MQTRYLKTLVTACELGSFSRAAEQLNITQSAVSQRIKALEDHFGQQLLDRNNAGLELTPAGQVVLARAREILDRERDLLDCLRVAQSQKRLALCCTPTFGMVYLARVLNEFIRRHADLADLKFHFMQPAEALRGLRSEEFDVAVIEHCLDQDFGDFDRFVLPDDELLFVAAPALGLKVRDGFVALDDLAGQRFFGRRDGCSSKEMLRSNLKQLGRDFAAFGSMVVSDDLRFTLQTVLDGGGIAYVSRALVADHLASGALLGLRVKGFGHRRGRSVVLFGRRQDDLLLGSLLECLFEVVSPLWRPQLLRGVGPG